MVGRPPDKCGGSWVFHEIYADFINEIHNKIRQEKKISI